MDVWWNKMLKKISNAEWAKIAARAMVGIWVYMNKKESFRCRGCIGAHSGCNLVTFDPEENGLEEMDSSIPAWSRRKPLDLPHNMNAIW